MKRNQPWDKKIETALVPIARRIMTGHFLTWLLRGMAAGLVTGVLFLALSFMFPWAGVGKLCWQVMGGALIAALVLAYIYRPDLWEIACMADSKGLQERVSTALELSEEDSPMVQKQRNDALTALKSFDLKAAFPFIFPRREAYVLSTAALLTGFLLVFPNPQQAEVERQMAIKEEIIRQEKNIAEVKKEIEKNNPLTPDEDREDRMEALKSLEELQQDLKKAENLKQALQALAQSEEKLNNLRLANLRQEESGRSLSSTPARQGEGKASTDKDSSDRSASNSAALSEKEQDDLEEADINQSYSPAGSTNSQEQGGSNGRSSDNSGDGQGSTDKAGGKSSEQSLFRADLNIAQRAIQDSRRALLATANGLPSQMASSGGTPGSTSNPGNAGTAANSGQAGQSSSQSSAPGSSSSGSPGGNPSPNSPGGSQGMGSNGSTVPGSGESGSPDGSGSGTGTGSGTGIGSGSGSGTGSGAGLGTSSGSNSSSTQSSTSDAASAGGDLAVMKYRDYEKIFDPQRIGRSGESSYVQGQAGEGPQQTMETRDGAIMPGSMRPYREVIAHYSQAARESLGRQPIPAGMSEVVRQYFSSLEE